MKRIEYNSDFFDDDTDIKCPICNSTYLNHNKVELFEREEDESTGSHITIQNGVSTSDDNLTNNPSKRRTGIIIHFECEMCDNKNKTHKLAIVQHKGNTLIYWLDK